MARKRIEKEKRSKEPFVMEYIDEISLSLSFDLICRKMLEFSRNVMGYSNCAVLLLDEDTDEIYVKDFVGYGKKFRNWRIAQDSPKGLIPFTVRSKKTFYCPDVTKEKRYIKGGLQDIESELIIPLKVKDKVFGVINVESRKKDGFPSSDIKLFEMLASTASIAMENSRLFEKLSSLKSFNENIVLSVEEGILLEDENGIIEFVNPRTEEMLGYSSRELLGKHWSFIVAEEYKDQMMVETEKRPKGIKSRYQAAVVSKKGKVIPIIISARPLFDSKKFTGVLSTFTDLTEMLYSQGEMRRLKEFQENILKNTPIGIFTTDAKGNVTSANRAMIEILGSPSEDATKKFNVFELPTIKAVGWDKVFRKVIFEGQSIDGETVYTSYWGKKSNIRLKCIPLYEENKITGLIGIAEDATERKRAERVLQESEERYRALYRDNPSMFFTLDSEGKVISVNEFGANQLGYTVAELEGQSVLKVFHRDDHRAVTEQLKNCLQNPWQVFRWEFRKVRKDGSVLWVEEHARGVVGSEGVSNVFVVCQDITERKKAEEQLRESEEKYRSIFENAFDGIYKSTPEGRILVANPAFVRMLGYASEEELLSIKAQDIYFDPEDRKRLGRKLEKEGELHNVELTLKRKEGRSVTFLENAHAVYDKKGKILYYEGTLTDITERKESEEAKGKTLERLNAIRKIGLNLTSQLDLETVLHSIVQQAIGLLGAASGGLYIYKPEKDVIEWSVSIGLDQVPIGAALHYGEGLSGKVWEGGNPIIVEDYQKWEGRSEKYEDYPWKGVAGVPMRWGEEFLGVLTILSKPTSSFTHEDIELITLFAASASVAIVNARLFEAAKQELKERRLAEEKLNAISSFSQEMALSKDFSEIKSIVFECAKKVLNFDDSTILLVDEQKKELYIAGINYEENIGFERYPLDSEKGVTVWVAKNGRPLIIPDVSAEPRYLPGLQGASSELAVPMKVKDTVIGVLDVESKRLNAFSENDCALLSILANSAAVAILSMRLLEKEHKDAVRIQNILSEKSALLAQLSKLFEVSNVTTKLTSLQETLDTVVNAIRDSGTWSGAIISLLDEDGFMRRRAFAGISEENRRRLKETPVSPKIQKILFDERMRISRSYYHPHDAPTNKALLNSVATRSPIPLKLCVDWHPDDVLVIPFYDRAGNKQGYLNVDEPADGRRPTEEKIRILEIFANSVAVAIENAGLYSQAKREIEERRKAETALERRAEEMSALYETSLEINAQPDLKTLLIAIVKRAANLLGMDMGALYLMKPDGQSLELMVGYNMPKDYTGAVLRLGEGVSGRVAQTGKPFMLEDHSQWEGKASIFADEPFRRILGVPLKIGDRVMGVLNVTDVEHKGLFSEEEIRLTSLFADQAAIAIQNARLLEKEKESARRNESLLVQISKLFEVSNTVTKLTSLQETMDTIVNAIHDSGTWRVAVIALKDEKGYLWRSAFAGVTEEEKRILLESPFSPEMQESLFDESARISHSYYHIHGGPTMRALNAVVLLSHMSLEECVDWHPDDLLIIPFHDKTGGLLGYLCVDEPTDGRRPTEETIKILETFANNASVAIENARLLEKEKDSTRRAESLLTQLAKLFEVSNTVTQLSSLQETLDTIVNAVKDTGTWRTALIALKDEKGYFHRCAFAGMTEEEKNALRSKPISPEIRGFLFDEKVLISRSYYHPHGGPSLRALDEVAVPSRMTLNECVDWHPEDLLIIPFYNKEGNILGYLNVDEPMDGRRPTEESLKILETFANNAAVAIENARLYKDIRETRDHLQNIIESSTEGIIASDMKGTILTYNRGAEIILGFTSKEALGTNILDYYPQGLPKRIIKMMHESQDGKVLDFEFDVKGKGGEEIPISLSASFLYDEKGYHMGTLGVFRDLREKKKMEEKLAVIYDVSKEISLTMDLDKIFEKVVDVCQKIFKFKIMAISLVDEEREELYVKKHIGYPKGRKEEIQSIKRSLKGEGGIVLAAVRDGKSIIIPDVSKDLRYIQIDSRIESELAVPLKVGEKVIGVLNVESESLDAFSEDDKRLLETLASQTAIAIENAQLLEKEKESTQRTESLLVQLSKLFEVSDTITKLKSVQETLDAIVNAIVESGTWRIGIISLKDENGSMRRCAFAGLTEDEKKRLSQKPVPPEIQKIMFDEKMHISRSYYHPHGEPTLRALDMVILPSKMPLEECIDWHPEDILFIPFYSKEGEILGYLNVDEPTDGRRPTEETIRILETFANNAAVAMENARLFEEERRRVNQLSIINELSKKITSMLDLSEITGVVTEDLQKMFSFYNVELYLVEENTLVLKAASGIPEEKKKTGESIAFGIGMVGWSAKFEETVLSNDVTKESRYVEDLPRDVRSELCIPLKIQKEVVGVLNIESDRPNAFNEGDVYTLETLSGQIATSMKNAGLFEGEKRNAAQLAMINEMSKKMTSTLDIREIAEILVENIQNMFSLYSVELYLKEEEGILLAACAGASEGRLEAGKFQALEEGMIGWTAKYGKTSLANDVTKEERFLRHILEDTKSELCIPLRIQTEVVGVLNLESDRVDAFSEEDVFILETLSGQIASTIKNARLYEEIKDFSRMLQTKVDEKTRKMEALLETSFSLRQITSWELGSKTIVEGIVNGLKLESASLFLINERSNTLEFKAGAGAFSSIENARLPLSDAKPVAIKCIREKRAINIKDASSDPRVEIQIGMTIPSFAWIPILSQNEVLGAICVGNPKSKVPVSDEDIEILTLYANTTALFLEKTRFLVSPAMERKLPTQMKYRLAPMEGYLVYEERADRAFEIFIDQVTHGIQGFCVTRMPSDNVRKKYKLEKTPLVWLSHAGIKESLDPQDLGKMNHIITEFLNRAEDAVVLLEGLEYLITENDFSRVIKALHSLLDSVVLSNARLILPMNPRTLSEKELNILEREFIIFK